MKRLQYICIAASFIFCFFLTSCGDSIDSKTDITSDGIVIYDTDTATDSLNYTNYVNKELGLVINILSSHITQADNLDKGKYIVKDEITALESDLDRVSEAIDSVEGLNPPNEYEDDREDILTRMVNAENTLKNYLEALNNPDINYDDYISLMEGDVAALTAVYNLPWE